MVNIHWPESIQRKIIKSIKEVTETNIFSWKDYLISLYLVYQYFSKICKSTSIRLKLFGAYILEFSSTWCFCKKWLIAMISLGLEFNSLTKRIKDDSKVKINVLHWRERIFFWLWNFRDIHRRISARCHPIRHLSDVVFQQKTLTVS